ncbi:hypothetical protein ACFV1W_04140 [Kitasatospora sp. NPDC059648]|uniref:hypothetical protein n=1 Tax=Kitasatospora sp. NPDC059648 TaxID=3346894 RepID=UPI0036B80A9A
MSGTLHGPGCAPAALPRRTGATGPVTAGLGQRADTVPGVQPGRAAAPEPYAAPPLP